MKPFLITSGVTPGEKYSGGGVRGQPGGYTVPSEQTALPRASRMQFRFGSVTTGKAASPGAPGAGGGHVYSLACCPSHFREFRIGINTESPYQEALRGE